MNFSNPNDLWRKYAKYKSDEERMKAGFKQGAKILLWLIIFFLVCVLLTGCKTVEYVPVTVVEHHTDSIYFTQVQRDSIWMHDSIMVSEKGDTVRIEKWHTKYIEKQVHDTTYVAKHDSIPVPYEVIKEVAKPLSKTEKGLMLIGILSLLAFLIFCAWKIKRFLPLR